MLGSARLARFALLCVAGASACSKVLRTPYGHVCACSDAEPCDAVPGIPALRPGQFVTVSSDASGNFMQSVPVTAMSPAPAGAPTERRIAVDRNRTHQTIKGFGNALTDAAAIGFHKMTAASQSALVESYWGATGSGLSIGRVPIASCDFSTGVYSYDDVPGDLSLASYSVDRDAALKLPLIHRALAAASNASGRAPLSLFASPWAPPAWMTAGNDTVQHPVLSGGYNGTVAHAYARYLVRFFEEYSQRDVLFWGLTVQNEPNGNGNKWQDLVMTAADQATFIKCCLGPALRASSVTEKLQLMILDDQRIHLPHYADVILADPEAAAYVSGVGVHWYTAVEDKTPSALYFGKLEDTHKKHPDKFLFATEACEGFLPWSHGPRLGSWDRGETYAHDIMGDMTAWVTGWTDWNAFLDETGGPNWAHNQVDSPIILNTTAKDVFYRQPMYYAMAHFSKYVVPGSKRIGVASTAPSLQVPMECIAFQRPDGLVVVVVLNRAWYTATYDVAVGGLLAKIGEVPAHSIQTIILAPATPTRSA